MAEWTNQPGAMLTAGGARLEYACWGPRPDQAPTIVLLHEGLGCVALWRDFPAQLAAATDALGRFYRARLAGLGHLRRIGMRAAHHAGPIKALITREASGQTGQVPSLLQ